VTPVSQLPGVVLARGGKLAILTESETDYDHRCTVRIHEKAGPTMQAVLSAL
jgi:NAD-dependent SIR2 family protein deacetylase